MQGDKGDKWCPKCQQYLPNVEFYRNSAQFDGLAPYCKVCWSVHNREMNTKRRAGKPDKRRIQMSLVRHDYFHCIEKPMQAYVLGLLAADGCVLSDRPRIQLGVHEQDRALVEIVQEELAPGYPIGVTPYKDKGYNMVKICFTSPKMCKDLATFCVVPRKSSVLAWPDQLPVKFINSYLLGVFDGDGWITLDKRKALPHYILGFISASPTFLERAAQEIKDTLDVPRAHLGTVNDGRTFTIRYGGKSARLLSEWMHRDLPGLARKRIPL
jgi:hypothetical protein